MQGIVKVQLYGKKSVYRLNIRVPQANHKGANNLPDKEIEFIVPDGIPYCHFPFWNQVKHPNIYAANFLIQKGYIAPYLMIRPKDPLPKGKVISTVKKVLIFDIQTVITCFPALKSLKKLSKGQDNIIEIVVNREN